MKKWLKIFAAVTAVTIMTASMSLSSLAATYKVCDANGDGNVDTKDVLILRKYLAHMPVTIDELAADSNFDGTINSKDLLIVRKVLAHIIDLPESPDTIKGLPDNYPKDVVENITVNQVGYTSSAQKLANIMVDKTGETYECYLVNARTRTTVMKATTTASKYHSLSEKYIAKLDFSSFTEAGDYFIATPLGLSYTFKINAQVYNNVQNSMIKALYYNRCGIALDKALVGENYYHDVCHNDATKPVFFVNIFNSEFNGYVYDTSLNSTSDKFSGGLHDAGDYGRYTTPANSVVADLVYMNEMFPNGTDVDVLKDNDGENIADVLDEARYEMKWLLKMQNQANGGVYFRLVTRKFADGSNGQPVLPDDDYMFDGRGYKGLYAAREMVKPSAGFAGAAAACYTAFKNIDPTFATQCLTAAKYAYKYVEANIDKPGAQDAFDNSSEKSIKGATLCSAGEYGSTEVYGDYFFAASALFRATNESQYNDMAKKIFDSKMATGAVSCSSIDAYNLGGAGSLAYLLNDKADATYQQKILAKMKQSVEDNVRFSKTDDFNNVIGNYNWGSNSAMGVITKKMAFVSYFTKTTEYDDVIQNSLGFMLGNNWSGYCFVTGEGTKSPQNILDRPSMVAKSKNGAAPKPGWVVAGINGTYYKDVNNDASRNEITIYWNSSPMFSMAYIVAKNKAS